MSSELSHFRALNILLILTKNKIKKVVIMKKQGLKHYFAASNSFYGFKSYFDTIFDRQKFDKIYIIKGGPGTGKSTFMKKVTKEFETYASCQTIFCSSDPDSVDGVIIEYNKKRVGIIDGTAPHEEDTRFPGAIDELINLGEAWNEAFLESNKKEILELTLKKKKHYKTSYDLLDIAGQSFKKMIRITKDAYRGNDEQEICNIIYEFDIKKQCRNSSGVLLSSF